MKKFDELPKSIKKTIRYINQDASFEQLVYLKQYLNKVIENRERMFLDDKLKK